MWILRGKPENIHVEIVVNSCDKGYQETCLRFMVSGTKNTKDDCFYVGIPYPICASKSNGGITMCVPECRKYLPELDNVRKLTEQDITIYESPRKLKGNLDFELIYLQDLCQWHVDDIGIIGCWIKNGEWTELLYRHKIGYDSKLFVPSRLPLVIGASNINIEYKIWVLNAKLYNLQSHLQRVSENQFTIKNWTWEEDTTFHTHNWESSDDESDREHEE
jgi:hypothetical protein